MEKLPSRLMPCALSIGNFDGLHLGHRALLEKLIKIGREKQLSSVLLSFDPHPMKILHPEKPFHKLFPLKDLVLQAEQMGLDALVVHPFTKEFSNISPERFFTDHIFAQLKPEYLLLGHDFRFGNNRGGSIDLVQKLCSERSCQVEEFAEQKVSGQRVSSSLIRQSIISGELSLAKTYLGRPFTIYGKVIHGDKRGHQIGFPTANIESQNDILPAKSVYITELEWSGRTLPSVTNIGVQPSFEESAHNLVVETHIFNFSENIYGEEVRLRFHKRLRDEKRFESIELLKQQITQDIKEAQKYFELLK